MSSLRDDALRDYARKARPDQVLVECLTGPFDQNGVYRRDSGALRARLVMAGRRFGYEVRFGLAPTTSAPTSSLPALARLAPPQAEMSHLILIEDSPFDAAVVEQLEQALRHWNSASVAFAYRDEREMYAAEASIEASKQRTASRLNFLFPDTRIGNIRIVSDQKIVDNAVCDTVRVKFTPVARDRTIELPGAPRAYFEAASTVYASECMFLRAPSDGYIAARHGAGFFITATRTTKVGLDLNRISFVHAYDRTTNTLTYSGPFLPSSDAVEAAIVLDACPHVDHLLHTHASKLFTRNPAFAARALVPQLPYGEPELGDALVAALREVGDGFVIMQEHGEVFAGTGVASDFLAGVRRRCQEARVALAAA